MMPSAPVSSVSASASASTSALPPDGEPSAAAFSHISRASAAAAIQHLDRYAFPDTLPTSPVSPLKRRKVSDVVESRASRFSNLAGLSQLHRERARLRRSERLAASSCSGKRGGKAKGEEERLSTFSMSTYSTKPAACTALGPVALAMRGWMHTSGRERDVLTCATCQAEWKAEVRGGLSDFEREQAWKAVEESVQPRHLAWCPWRLRGCHASLYRVPVHSRLETLTELLKVAREFAQCPGIEQVKVTSDLSEPEQDLLRALSSSETPASCLLLSLLGWRASEGAKAVEDCIIQCSMCSRRIGLWGFIDGSRALHVALEHKTYCPYVSGQTQSAGQGRRPGEPDNNAWRQRLQVLVGGGTRGQGTLSQDQVRTMRSSEVLAKVKSMMM